MTMSFPVTRRAVTAGAVGAAVGADDQPRGVRLRRGYSNNNIGAVLGGNFRRLLGQVWG